MEIDLIQRAQQGDQQAFRELVDQYAAVVWRTARVMLPDRSLTEDMVQESWLQVWQSLPRFDVTRPLRPWLLKIVANQCRMVQRRHVPASISLDEASDDVAVSLTLADDVADHAIRAELRDQVAAACAVLSLDINRILLSPTEYIPGPWHIVLPAK